MLRLRAWGGTVGRVVSRARRTGLTVGFIIGSATLFAGAAATKIDPQDAEFLASVNRSITELAGQAGPQASSTCDRIVASAINMDAVTQSALSRMWGRISPQQRIAFRAAARRWAVRDCLRRNQGNGGNPLEFLGVRQGEDGERLLATRSSKPAHTIIWHLRGSGRVRAVDVVIDGGSMILSLRDETKALLDRNNGDFDMATEILGR
jgi:ABC-type transporter MlaC component